MSEKDISENVIHNNEAESIGAELEGKIPDVAGNDNSDSVDELTDSTDNTSNSESNISSDDATSNSDEDSESSSDDNSDAKEKDAEAEKRGEDNLELHNLSKKERRKKKREKLLENMEGMSKKEKLSYLAYYYKGKVIVGLIIIFCVIAIPLTIYKHSRPVAMSYALLNVTSTDTTDEDSFQTYKDYYGYSKSDQILVSAFIGLDLDTYEEDYENNSDSANFTSLPTLCYKGYFDVVIGDEKAIEYCAGLSLIQPLNASLLNDIYEDISTNHSDSIYECKNSYDESKPYAIDITDTEFAKSLNLGIDKVYLGFAGITDRNFKNSKMLLNYIFNPDTTAH